MVSKKLPKVLLVEDERELATKLAKRLEREGFTTDAVHDGLTGLRMLKQYVYDVVVADWNMPAMSGPEMIEAFRRDGGVTPVIMLTGKHEIGDKVAGFQAGADDYLTKPFEADELIVRLRALIRRAPTYKTNVLEMGILKVDVDASTAFMGEHELQLQRLEFRLLEFLLRHPGQTFTADALLDRVWPADSEASTETVRGYIKTLRKKLSQRGDKPRIRNLYGLGYKIDLTDD